jgi:protein arginine kinase activator
MGLVEKIHDASQHVGKAPKRVSSDVSLQKEMRQLQVELKRAVRREDYEKAAALRDQIKQLEEKFKSELPEVPGESEIAEEPPPGPGGHSRKKPEGGEKK